MSGSIDRELEACQARGEAVALARVVSGARPGSRMLIWRGGQALGSLGSPRLNQRVALYAEGLIVRGGAELKKFDLPEGEIEIETRVYRSA